MSVYSLTLDSGRYLDENVRYRPTIVEFSSQEQLESYKEAEYKFCKKEYENYAQAWTINERKEKFEALVAVRKTFRDVWFNIWFKPRVEEKDLA